MILGSLTIQVLNSNKILNSFKKICDLPLYSISTHEAPVIFLSVDSSRWQHKYSSLNLQQECEWNCGRELLFLKELITLLAVQLQLYCMVLKLKNIFISKNNCRSHELLEVTCTKKRYIEKICSEQLCKNFSVFPKVSPGRWQKKADSVSVLDNFSQCQSGKWSCRWSVLGNATVLKLLNPSKFSSTS